jgi:signal recognition particle receptor subunit beta
MSDSSAPRGTRSVRIVYCGPSESGKTTNLEALARALPDRARGRLVQLATDTNRTLYFDLLTIDASNGSAGPVIELFTVPGQNFYLTARRRILREADGIVFVADSRRERLAANVEALHDVVAAIHDSGRDLDRVPAVLQFNKCDEPSAMSPADLLAALECENEPFVQAVAHEGRGVVETFRLVARRAFATRAIAEPVI